MGCPTECELGDNLVFSVCTHDPDTGVLTDADSEPSYRIYEDETATVISNGVMTKLDDGNTTGFYTKFIECIEDNGFEKGKTYTIYIEITVDSDMGGMTYAFKVLETARGLLQLDFTSRQPILAFTSKRPSVLFTSRVPTLTFTGKG